MRVPSVRSHTLYTGGHGYVGPVPHDPPRVRPTIPPVLWVVGVLAYVPVIVVLVLLALQLEDTRGTVDGRLAVAVGQLRDSNLPLAREARADRPAAKRLTAESLPLVRDLSESDAGRQLGLVGALAADLGNRDAGTQLERSGALSTNLLGVDAGKQLARSGALSSNLLRVDPGRQLARSGDLADALLGADIGGTVSTVRRLTALLGDADLPATAAGLRDASLPATARSLRETTDELNRGTRLARLIPRLTAVAGEAKTLEFVPKATRAAESVTRELVPIARRILQLQEQTLELTRDTNRRTTNIDRKLGGDLLVPPVP